MKEFNEVLERLHPEDDTVVRSALLLVAGHGWVIQYDVGADLEPWIANVVAGTVKWAHPVDYDVTQLDAEEQKWLNAKLSPKPVTLDENIGSCEPGPLIRWDKTGSVWHTDVDKVGRYSLQRINRQWVAFLNNKPIEAISPGELDAMKRNVERRIETARRINALPFQSPLGSRNV